MRSVSPVGECYLRPNPYDNVVNTDGYIVIIPVNPAYLYAPVYTPAVVFAPPRPGILVGLSIYHRRSSLGPHLGQSNRLCSPYANAYRPGPGPRVEDHHAAAYHHPDEHPH